MLPTTVRAAAEMPAWETASVGVIGGLRAAARIGNLHVCCDPDERWYAYRNLRGTELIRARALARSVPCATSLLLWAIVTPAHGRGWCAGELALLALWLAALALPRAYGRWFTGHPAMLLASRAAAGAMVVFPLLALTRVPAWPGLVISLLAGAGLLAAVARAARSRTGGAVTRRARGGIFSTRYGRIRSLK